MRCARTSDKSISSLCEALHHIQCGPLQARHEQIYQCTHTSSSPSAPFLINGFVNPQQKATRRKEKIVRSKLGMIDFMIERYIKVVLLSTVLSMFIALCSIKLHFCPVEIMQLHRLVIHPFKS